MGFQGNEELVLGYALPHLQAALKVGCLGCPGDQPGFLSHVPGWLLAQRL